MLKIILLLTLMSNLSFAGSQSSEVEFQNSSIHFQAIKTKSKMTFSDGLGPREIEIKNCNRKIVETFWSGLIKNVNSLQSSEPFKGRLPSSGAWLKYEGVQFRVLD